MKTPNEAKQKIKENEKQNPKEQKVSSCCGPTCCGGSNNKINNERKEN